MTFKERPRLGHFSWLCKEEKLLKVLILAVPNSDAIRLADELERGGFTLVAETALNPEGFKAALPRQDWDAVIAGGLIPRLDIRDIAHDLQQAKHSAPLIWLTDIPGEAQAAQAARDGMIYDYLVKEQGLTRLLPLVERSLRERKSRQELTATRLNPQWEVLLAAVTHELRSPIRVELQLLELLRQGQFGELNPGQDNLLDGLLHAKRAMIHLVENMLWLLTESEYNAELRSKPLDLNALIQEDLLPRFDILAEAKGLALMLTLHEHLPLLQVDALKVSLVLGNLIQNAVTYTEAGGQITLRSRLREGQVMILVEDTGIGIQPDEVESLFATCLSAKPRYRSGAGLGLYISKRIIDSLGGAIGLQTEVGKGSTFYFTVPVGGRPVGSNPLDGLEPTNH